MERNDRAPVATFFLGAPWPEAGRVALGESAVHHARVKRLETGEPVRLTNGAGQLGFGALHTLSKTSLEVELERVESVPAPRAIHLRVPIADRDRMLWLAEKATELGVASWESIRFRRSLSVTPRGEGPAFAAKLRARMENALEQSGGAWLPQLLDEASVDELCGTPHALPILLDVSGAAPQL